MSFIHAYTIIYIYYCIIYIISYIIDYILYILYIYIYVHIVYCVYIYMYIYILYIYIYIISLSLSLSLSVRYMVSIWSSAPLKLKGWRANHGHIAPAAQDAVSKPGPTVSTDWFDGNFMGIHGLIHLPTTSLFGKSTISKKRTSTARNHHADEF